MPNADPNKESHPEITEELEELGQRLLKPSTKDRPAIPSSLLTKDAIDLEMAIEGLRVKREERLTLTWSRRGYVLLLCLMLLIALASAAVIAVELGSGGKHLVGVALASLSGAGAGGTFVWRAQLGRFLPRRKAESG